MNTCQYSHSTNNIKLKNSIVVAPPPPVNEDVCIIRLDAPQDHIIISYGTLERMLINQYIGSVNTPQCPTCRVDIEQVIIRINNIKLNV